MWHLLNTLAYQQYVALELFELMLSKSCECEFLDGGAGKYTEFCFFPPLSKCNSPVSTELKTAAGVSIGSWFSCSC